jgi:hypothetical protein
MDDELVEQVLGDETAGEYDRIREREQLRDRLDGTLPLP